MLNYLNKNKYFIIAEHLSVSMDNRAHGMRQVIFHYRLES